MAPRPRPAHDESLLADEKPYSLFLLSTGTTATTTTSPGRSMGLDHFLGLDSTCTTSTDSSSWDDEDIELTSASARQDPLWVSMEETACRNDGEIAALMAAEWSKEERTKRRQALKQHDVLERRQKIGCLVMLVVAALSGIGWGVYTIVHHHHHHRLHHPPAATYQCPAREEWAWQRKNLTLCRDPEQDCGCHNPNPESATVTEEMKRDAEILLQQQQSSSNDQLDVVFMGRFDGMDWNNESVLRQVHIAGEPDSRASSMLYSLIEPDLIPTSVQPKVWWISLGGKDIIWDGCSLDAVQSGVYQIVQAIVDRDDQAKIVLSSNLPIQSSFQDAWSDRLRCVASSYEGEDQQQHVEYYDPYHPAQPEDDDDLFLDVASKGAGSSGTTQVAAPLEAQQAIVNKILDLLH